MCSKSNVTKKTKYANQQHLFCEHESHNIIITFLSNKNTLYEYNSE